MEPPKKKSLKYVLIGEAGSGKTSILHKYKYNADM